MYTAGDARSASDTMARATCPVCGHTGLENEMCTYGLDPLNLLENIQAKEACAHRRAAKKQQEAA